MDNDLISRSALLGAIDAEFFKTDPMGEEQLGFLTCRRIARTAPAVDADVVRHGYWIPQDSSRTKFMCSDCKSRNHDGSGKFCSQCGCKMDAEVEG